MANDGSTGFTERNQSTNYTMAYERSVGIHQTMIVPWFEFQITGLNGNNDNHIDAVIIDTHKKRILLTEAKRLLHNGLKEQKEAIQKDIVRMMSCSKSELFSNRLYNEDINGYQMYGCILADIWDYEGANRRAIDFLKPLNHSTQKISTILDSISKAGCISGMQKDIEAVSIFPKGLYNFGYEQGLLAASDSV